VRSKSGRHGRRKSAHQMQIDPQRRSEQIQSHVESGTERTDELARSPEGNRSMPAPSQVPRQHRVPTVRVCGRCTCSNAEYGHLRYIPGKRRLHISHLKRLTVAQGRNRYTVVYRVTVRSLLVQNTVLAPQEFDASSHGGW